MNGTIAYALSKSYVDATLQGAGALKGQDGKNGTDGKSAYQIAVDNGFDGTEQEWLDSINGQNGKDGKDGVDGVDGFSPTITEDENNTADIYKLNITTKDSTFTTPNLKGKDGTGEGSSTVEISQEANNALVEKADGLYVPTTTETKVSAETDNQIETKDDGIYVAPTDTSNFVEKEDGKGLSSNDFTTAEKEKLADLENYDDTTIKQSITDLETNVKANEDAITILNGDGEGSVAKTVDDALNKFATDISDDNVVNTYKELVDYAASHSSDVAEMVADIQANTTAIGENKTAIENINTTIGIETLTTTAQDLTGAIVELKTAVDDTTLADKVQAIEDDYLTSADKTELSDAIAELDEEIGVKLADAVADEVANQLNLATDEDIEGLW